MWGKIIIPVYRLWLHGLYGLYGPWCPLSPKRPINLISLSLMPGQKSFYVVLYHNDFSPSNEQHERVLAYTLWQPTYGYIAIFQNYCFITKHEGYYEKLNSTKSLGIYYWYVKIQCTPDISRSCISRNWIYCGHVLDPIFWRPRAWYFSRNRGHSLDPIRGRQ